MSESTRKPPFIKIAVLFIVLGVAALAIIFVVLASIGDDVPTELPAATQKSTGE